MSAPDESLDGHLFGPGQPCFGCGPDHPHGFRMAFTREGDEIVTRFTPAALHQGPVGIMHGGLVATLADELAAWAIIGMIGKFPFTASFEARIHKPTRIGVELEGRSRIVKDMKRLFDVEAKLVQNGEPTFTGSFRFVVLDQAGAEKMLGQKIPDEWKRFCR